MSAAADAHAAGPVCERCGRRMAPRRRWRGQPQPARYCSERCRRTRPGATDHALERAILELLDARAGDASICPSEAARRVSPDGWRALMQPARAAARRLVAREVLVITQQGRVVDPSTARGPIRLRRPRAGETAAR